MFFSVLKLEEQVRPVLELCLLLLRRKLEFAVVVAAVGASYLAEEMVAVVAASFVDAAVAASSAAGNLVVVGVEADASEVGACHHEVQVDGIAGEGVDFVGDVEEDVD